MKLRRLSYEIGQKMKPFAPLLFAAFALSGCATRPAATPEQMEVALKPLYCQSGEQCSAMWKRAQVWLATNGHYRLQLVSDAVINTYGPIHAEMWFAYQVTREPQEGGIEQIRIAGGCGNRFGCLGDIMIETAKFKTYVLEASAPQVVVK